MKTTTHLDREGQRGQILVLFALGAVAMIAMVGLVLDGGGAYAQRRQLQNGADVAALAGANAYMNTAGSVSARTAAARGAAIAAGTRNGYTNGAADTTLSATVTLLSSGAEVRVDISRPHENGFARIAGFDRWPVSVTASAIAGTIDTGVGAAPWIMNVGAFHPDGSPRYTQANPIAFGWENGSDYPLNPEDIAWTDFNGSNNVNDNEVADIINGSNVVTATVDFDQYIGQHNQGVRANLFDDVDQYLAGTDVPVPIVGPCPAGSPHPDGCYKGWALFHVISGSGGSNKDIVGYFVSDFRSKPLTVGECTPAQQAAGTCGVISVNPFGAYVVRLSN